MLKVYRVVILVLCVAVLSLCYIAYHHDDEVEYWKAQAEGYRKNADRAIAQTKEAIQESREAHAISQDCIINYRRALDLLKSRTP